MTNRAEQKAQYNPIIVSSFNVDDLSPGGLILGKTCILPVNFDSVHKWRRCYLNIDINLPDRAIASTSTAAIYLNVEYVTFDGTSTSVWVLHWNPADVPPVATSPAYGGNDPDLQSALVITPGTGDYYWSTSIDLVNRKTYAEGVYEQRDDASTLLLERGYFVVAPYFASSDGRNSLGAGVTNADIFALNAITNVTLTAYPAFAI